MVHGAINLVLGLGNALLIGFVFLTLWQGASDWAKAVNVGLLHWINLPAWAGAIVAVMLLDFWTYWWHRINHEWPFLWRFHRMHHSDPEMDVTTANRFHIGEIAMSSLLRVPVIILIGAEIWHVALFEVLMFPVVQFHHSNIRLPGKMDRLISLLFPSPGMHKIHHSDRPLETNSNYTSFLSVWDRIFRTFRYREDWENIRLGLTYFRSSKDQGLFGLLISPLKRAKSDQTRPASSSR